MNDEQIVDEAVGLLSVIVKGAHAAKACHPGLAGLSLAQAKATAHLYHHGRIPVGELATAVDLSMPAASELVDRLVEEGYAAREINPADRRQVLVSLTPYATQVAREMIDLRRAQIRSAISRLAPDERPIFLRSLQVLAAALREPVGCAGRGADADQSERGDMKQTQTQMMGRNQ